MNRVLLTALFLTLLQGGWCQRSQLRSFASDEQIRCLNKLPRPPQTMDQLIALIEKFEQMYPYFGPSEIAARLLTSFRIDGLYRESTVTGYDATVQIRGEDQHKQTIQSVLMMPNNGVPGNVYTDDQRCTLTYLLSSSTETRSINDLTQNERRTRYRRQAPTVYNNPSYNNPTVRTNTNYNTNYNTNNQNYNYDTNSNVRRTMWSSDGTTYLVATGSVETGQGTVSPGVVLAGVAASNFTKSFTLKVSDILPSPMTTIINSTNSATKTVDVIEAATIGVELAQDFILTKAMTRPEIYYLGSEGNWTNAYCPWEYQLFYQPSLATTPDIWGAMDGLILGNYYRERVSNANQARLSQTLRAYYGAGITDGSLQACRREDNFKMRNPRETVHIMSYIFYDLHPPTNSLTAYEQAFNVFYSNFTNNFTANTQRNSCPPAGLDVCEAKLDIIIVMDATDTTGTGLNSYLEQRNFISKLVSKLDVYVNGSLVVAVINDSSIDSDDPISWRARPYDNPPLSNQEVFSGGDLICNVQRNPISAQSTNMENVIKKLQRMTKDRKRIERQYKDSNPPGKVIIFVTRQKITDKALDALNSYKYEQKDIYVLGIGQSVDDLKNIVRDSTRDIFTANPSYSDTVDALIPRLCQIGSQMEYFDCRKKGSDRSNELSWPTVEYVSNNKYETFAMTQMTMNSSGTVTFHVSIDYGTAQVCKSRNGQVGQGTCQDVNQGSVVNFYESASCKKKSYCTPIYLMAQNVRANGQCTDTGCRNLNQVKLNITHEGSYCNGAWTGSVTTRLVTSLTLALLATLMRASL